MRQNLLEEMGKYEGNDSNVYNQQMQNKNKKQKRIVGVMMKPYCEAVRIDFR